VNAVSRRGKLHRQFRQSAEPLEASRKILVPLPQAGEAAGVAVRDREAALANQVEARLQTVHIDREPAVEPALAAEEGLEVLGRDVVQRPGVAAVEDEGVGPVQHRVRLVPDLLVKVEQRCMFHADRDVGDVCEKAGFEVGLRAGIYPPLRCLKGESCVLWEDV
jgi:hypothetical protein